MLDKVSNDSCSEASQPGPLDHLTITFHCPGEKCRTPITRAVGWIKLNGELTCHRCFLRVRLDRSQFFAALNPGVFHDDGEFAT